MFTIVSLSLSLSLSLSPYAVSPHPLALIPLYLHPSLPSLIPLLPFLPLSLPSLPPYLSFSLTQICHRKMKDAVFVLAHHRSVLLVSAFRTKDLAITAEKVGNAKTHMAIARAGRGRGNDLVIVRSPKMKVKDRGGKWK